MEFAEIRRSLETASRPPEEELRAALAHADALLPLVSGLIDKLKAGVFLLPDQQWLLIYGLHVLAAARATALLPAWCDLLRLPDALDALFGDDAVIAAVGITLSLAGDDPEPIFALLDGGAAAGAAGWALFEVLARMAWDGHADLARTRELLTRFERDDRLPPEDDCWNGWLDAVILLGLVELIPAMERVLAKPAVADFHPADSSEPFDRLRDASAHFADGERFAVDGIAPFDDPVDGLAWLRHTDDDEPESETLADPDEPADPAAAIRLGVDEEIWLRDFLDSAQVPETTMNLEALDGFLTALAVAPEPVPPTEFLAEIWGKAAPRGGTFFDSPAQQDYVERLLERHRETIARRIAANVAVEPFLFADDGDDFAADWGSAFMIGVALRPRAWAPLIRHRSAGRLTASVTALFDDDPEEPLTPELRRDIVDALPQIVLGIADFWRSGDRGLAQPVRSEKIGRNDPCPCGSGKKYKKCCGAAA